MNDPFFEQLKHYENKWIVYLRSSKKIVSSGGDGLKALQRAKKKGYTDLVLYKVPGFDAHSILSL
jgi:hypothetical protein